MLPSLQVRRRSQPASWDQADELGFDPGRVASEPTPLTAALTPLQSPSPVLNRKSPYESKSGFRVSTEALRA